MVKIREIKGKLPNKKTINCACGDKYKCGCGNKMYNSGQDSFAELEVSVDEDELSRIIRELDPHGAPRKIAKAIAASLKEILVIKDGK